MGKKSFVFNIEWQEVLMDYPAEVRYEVYDAIIGYAASGTLPELKPLAKMAFSFIKKEMDYNAGRYNEIAEKRKSAAQKRWVSEDRTIQTAEEECKSSDSMQMDANDANGCTCMQTMQMDANDANGCTCMQTMQMDANDANGCYNDNDNDYIKEPSKEGKKTTSRFPEINFQEIINLYHSICKSYPRIIKLSPKRKQKIAIRFAEEMRADFKLLESIFRKMEASKFLRGDNKRGWKATFDWVFENSQNWVKIAEGNFDEGQKQTDSVNDIWNL